MRAARAAAALAGALCLLGAAAVPASAITVAGRVANGTAAGGPVDGLVVTAVRIAEDGKEGERAQATVAGGTFRVDGLGDAPGSRYLVAVDYGGVTYSTMARGTGPEAAADLTVYETTEDESVLRVVSDTLTVVQGEGATYEVLQILRVANASDRTFVGKAAGEGRRVLGLPVPFGAFDLVPGEGLSPQGLSAMPGGVATSAPVLPGEWSVSYIYKVRVPRSGWLLTRPVIYPTDRVDILAGQGLAVDGEGFDYQQQVTLGERTYRRYRGGPFGAEAEVQAQVAPSARASPLLWWGLGAAAAVVLAAALGTPALLRRRRARRQPEIPLPSARERLVEEIAALDEAFASGTVGEKEYAASRAALKARLAALTAELAASGVRSTRQASLVRVMETPSPPEDLPDPPDPGRG